MQDHLRDLRALPEWAEIGRDFGPQNIRTVEDASRVGWVAGDVNFAMVRAIHHQVGLERGQEFFYKRFAAAWDSPIFQPIVRGAMRMLRADPGGLLSMIPKGHGLAFRGFGRYEVVEKTSHSLSLRHFEVPAECFVDDAAWIRFAGFSQLSLIALADGEGTVEWSIDASRREAVHHFAW